ncbi:MAG: sulfatase-like hydrolase/transferase [Neisseriaceae bacterium]|nr:sulfatase-like hydrolase/transferase [Neisseriaceae bacterium]
MNENILKKEFQLPKCDKKALGRFILSFLIPNIVFLLVCFFLSATRPVINIDYIFPCLLLAFNNKVIRITGVLSYVVTILIEAYMIIVQFFHFLDLAALRDFIPFVFDAPSEYIFLYSLLVLLLIVLPLFAWYLNEKQQKIYVTLLSIFVFALYYLFGYMGGFTYTYQKSDYVAKNYYIFSQFRSVETLRDGLFTRSLYEPAQLLPYPKDREDRERAAEVIKPPYNGKILLIVSESLNSLKNNQAQQEVFLKVIEQKNNYDFLVLGEIRVDGATVQGELRELCNLTTENGHDTRHFDMGNFSMCLPQILNKQNYHTVSFHGAGSTMYHRRSLYPKLGFKKMVFNEQMQDKKRCHSFKGTCDSEIFSLVAKEFANNDKSFVYWLTLTSHYPYSKKDIFNNRFECEKFDIKNDSYICRNIKMHTQFFDQLAELIQQPEMKGVEILVAGDHMSPTFEENIASIRKFKTTSFLHLKIKD